jgi:carbonic anhydrase
MGDFMKYSHSKAMAVFYKSPHHKIHWGYKGATGPSHWGDMDEKFSMCQILY